MTFKYELEVDSNKSASELKSKLTNINSNLVVKLIKNSKPGGTTFTVKTSLNNIQSLNDRIEVDRQVKSLYDEYRNKIMSNTESLREMVKRIIKEEIIGACK